MVSAQEIPEITRGLLLYRYRRLSEARAAARAALNLSTHHSKMSRGDMMPKAEQAFAALVSDLDQRGLLDTTLVAIG